MPETLSAGIDLGGTKIYTVILDHHGRVLGEAKKKTGEDRTVPAVLGRIEECLSEALAAADIPHDRLSAVGLAVPSAVRVETGTLLHAPNLGWKNLPLARRLADRLRHPVLLENDANCGTLAEYTFGKVQGLRQVFGIFVGTGIGGGYLFEGRIVRGRNGTAGEIGHMIVRKHGPRCACGNRGCLEAVASKTGVLRTVAAEVAEGRKTLLAKLKPDWRHGVGSSALRKCWDRKDPAVRHAVTKASRYLGIAAANLVNITGPDAFILGGGFADRFRDIFLPAIREALATYPIASGGRGVKVLPATLGDRAVAIGAAWAATRPEHHHLLHHPSKD